MKPIETTTPTLIVATTAFIMLLGNMAFFTNVVAIYPVSVSNIFFLLSLPIVFGGITVLFLSLICYQHTVKPILIVMLLLSSSAAYFMDSYNVIFDDTMIHNILSTDMEESLDLFSLKQIGYVLLLGVIPAILVYKIKIIPTSHKKSIVDRLKLMGVAVTLVAGSILLLSNFYASFLREHKPLRYYSNPVYFVYSAIKTVGTSFKGSALPLQAIALDAEIPHTDVERELIILVVGETARASHFSLNGYARQTNPQLEKEDVISYKNFWACGTSTAVSVPCMFSNLGRSGYSESTVNSTENILDVIQRAGVNVLWLDNNSDSKGVAVRVPYESYKAADKNTVCDIECRDEGMLTNLQAYIDSHPTGDIFIVLHQMGNHGPAYYKRYPKAFEKFTPTCQTNQLENCSLEEIHNAYDNAILYTDYFLSKVIGLLKANDDHFESAMFYMSDHGESLGENNLYLHGLPYIIAPDVQKRVPVIMWFGKEFTHDIDIDAMKGNINDKYSHDNLFHTLLGMMEVKTTAYNQSMDLINYREEEIN